MPFCEFLLFYISESADGIQAGGVEDQSEGGHAGHIPLHVRDLECRLGTVSGQPYRDNQSYWFT